MTTIQLTAEQTRNIAKTVGRFISPDPLRTWLSGVVIDASGEGIFAVASDGHRVGKLTLNPITEDGRDVAEYAFQHILSPDAVKWCGSLKVTRSNAWLPVKMEFTETRVNLTFLDVSASFALVEGNFPEWRRLMAKPEDNRITFNAEYLKEICEAVKAHSDLKNVGIEIAFDSPSGPARLRGVKEGLEIVLMPMRL